MKKIMSLMIGMSLMLGTASLFAQDDKKMDTTSPAPKKGKKMKKSKKSTDSTTTTDTTKKP